MAPPICLPACLPARIEWNSEGIVCIYDVTSSELGRCRLRGHSSTGPHWWKEQGRSSPQKYHSDAWLGGIRGTNVRCGIVLYIGVSVELHTLHWMIQWWRASGWLGRNEWGNGGGVSPPTNRGTSGYPASINYKDLLGFHITLYSFDYKNSERRLYLIRSSHYLASTTRI